MRFDVRDDLSVLRAEVTRQVNEGAGEVRMLFITVVAGQDMVYLEKRTEAEKIVADPGVGENVPAGETPHVTREALSSGVSRFDKSVEILTMAYNWAEASGLIEDRRTAANRAIEAALTAPAIRAAGAIDWSDIKALAPQ